MTTTTDAYAVVVLVPGDLGMRLAGSVRRSLNERATKRVHVTAPPVGGMAFLTAEGEYADALAAWWAAEVGQRLPVFIAMDEPDLPAWIPGTNGAWFVGVGDDARALAYDQLEPPAFPVVTADPAIVADQALQAVEAGSGEAGLLGPGFAFLSERQHWDARFPRLNVAAAEIAMGDGAAGIRAAGRLSMSSTMTGIARRLGAIQGVARRRLSRTATASDTGGLGHLANSHRPIVVAFGSRKGGVGKTTSAAAVAAIVGEAFEGLPDTAALVDANVTNPDSWALNPGPGAATVRLMISRLAAGEQPPDERYAATPRLAIYPESRSGEDCYTRAEIDLLANHLRRRHSFIAVDLPNSLPSLTSGGAPAVAAAWIHAADAVVLPFNADPRARQGTIEYIDLLRQEFVDADIPIIAPYVVSRNKEVAQDPGARADIDAVRRQRAYVVEIPEDDRALVALLQDRSITQASLPLRHAYMELARTIVEAVSCKRSGG